MFCKSCGRQIDNDSTFCSFCGTKQSTDLKPQVQADTNHSINTTQKTYSNETNFNNTPNIVRQPKYDPTYKKEDDAITVGIILLVIALIFAIVGPIEFEDRESYGQFRAVTAIISLILRIWVTIWVVNIAKRQNRETFGWGLFAFLLPSIALIVIATRKKLFANIQIVEGLDNEQNSKMLSDTVVMHPARTKLLFGSLAAPELRVKFRAVRNPNGSLTNDQIRAEILNVINSFFSIENWDFGVTFYATELIALIHQRLPLDLSSVVPVPLFANNSFGANFTIEAGDDEILQSAARLEDIEIVEYLSSSLLRQGTPT